MATAGLATGGLLVEGDFTFASGAAAARQLLDRANPPTAIIASSDQMALATLEVARERGLVVPDQLSIVSLYITPVAPLTPTALPAVDQPVPETASPGAAPSISAPRAAPSPTELTHAPWCRGASRRGTVGTSW